jgi:large repetitive protein
MIEFTRQPSGLYLAEPASNARVAFLFQDAGRTDPTFELTAQSWINSSALGYIAFFAPSATRDWNSFANGLRAAFTANAGTQIGWFPEPTTIQPVLVSVSGQGTATPMLAAAFSLVFRNSVTFQVQPSIFNPATTVLFDDATNSIQFGNAQQLPNVFIMNVTPPGGATVSFGSTAPYAALAMTGTLTGAAEVAFQFTTDNLAQFEAGMMYFSPPVAGGQVRALSYPVFRPAAGSNQPFNFNVTLNVLAQLDPNRTFFQFTDAVLGCNFVTANGKSFAFKTVSGDPGTASRLVFAGRPMQSATDQSFYYLTPAGKFGLTLDDPMSSGVTGGPDTVQMLCGITGTEFLSVNLGATPDSLEFVADNAAWRIPPLADSQTEPVYLDNTATTSYGRIVSTTGSYVSQPERAPLYQQPGKQAARVQGAVPSSGLNVHILNYFAVDSWLADQAAPPTPLVPYAGIPFTTDPNIAVTAYVDMESNALNPKRANAYVTAPPPANARPRLLADAESLTAMTPQGMIAELSGMPPVWNALDMAISAAGTLRIADMGPSIRRAVQQNQIFTVISNNPSTPDPLDSSVPLFSFAESSLQIGDWTFDLSSGGLAAPNGTPPIFILKFYPDQSIQDLVDDTRLWSAPDTFNGSFGPDKVQSYLQQVIEAAKTAVFPDGGEVPDTSSIYWNFYQTVTDPAFNGILCVNCNMELNKLPTAIKAVLGGMNDPGIAGFRVHHAGVAINNTSPDADTPTLARSAMFALVDYEKAGDTPPPGLSIDYGFEVEFLRALFINSELRDFSCQIQLTINSLFGTGVNQKDENVSGANSAGAGDDAGNTIVITGSYQANASSDSDDTSGEGIYSFVAEGDFVYDFTDKDGNPNNKYLKQITLTKLQFSFDQETEAASSLGSNTSSIKSHFGIWGNLTFNELKVLDLFSFEKLEFSNLGIDVAFDLTVKDGAQPSTSNLALAFAPGNLRLDLGATEQREGSNSLTKLIPFRLTSFLYSQHADETIESLSYYSLGSVAGLKDNGITLQDTFNYALIFELDLGSLGGLVGSLSAFRFSILIGWSSGENGGVAVGVQLPQVDGKLEIKIQGVITISIQQFNLEYATTTEPKMLVLGMNECYVEIFGTRIPPKGTISFGLFAPTEGADQIGWIAAYKLGEDGGGGEPDGGDNGEGEDTHQVAARRTMLLPVRGLKRSGENSGSGDEGSVFELVYLGLGQRVGPDPASPLTSYDEFLEFMMNTFWENLKNKDYGSIYHPDGRWIVVTNFKLLKIIEVGLVFYDVTPFYALQVKITGGVGAGFVFEITYTKISDTIGLFHSTLGLPNSLRTFNVGAASVTLPTLTVDVYTNGNWKVDLGFPDGDNWSPCFQVQAQAGPVPVTGSGGFYIAYLSTATNPDVFKGSYATIAGFGFAARLGVGKDFTAGPLRAGVSVTFFGIIQGAAGYLTSGGTDIMRTPDALSLQGQFGIIGELYGSIDFVIIKASVNVRLQASIGLVLTYEHGVAGADGTILLYIEASVSVSVSVKINLFLFSVTISFSFNASFRFDWYLVGKPDDSTSRLLAGFASARALAAPPALGLLPGLNATLPLLYLPELTVVFPNATDAGAPWAVVSLGVEYDAAPKPQPQYADFKPFEATATQLATFALMHALSLSSYDAEVWLESDPATGRVGMRDIDSAPELLTGWLDYPSVLAQLANFKGAVGLPTGDIHATVFPMPPFLTIATSGRTLNNQPADFSYPFQSQNELPLSYLQEVDAYFNQLFVNQTQNPPTARMLTEASAPLTQEIFLDFFKGLIRGAVHQLLVTMQNQGLEKAKLTDLFCAVAGAPSPTAQSLYQQLAGQMSSAMRGGLRLPFTAGMTVPGGTADPDTNSLFSVLWQQFPVGGFAKDNAYVITLSNPDKSQGWLIADAPFTLTSTWVDPYAQLTESAVAKPGQPTPIELTSTGPQAFAFDSTIVWTPPTGNALSLRTFPTALTRLQAAQGTSGIAVLVKSRAADGAYLPDGTALPAADVALATTITLTVKQIAGAAQGSVLPDVFGLSGASQSDEALLGMILDALRAGERPIASLQVLYQTEANAPGLVSATVDPEAVFVLRTNTTSVSQPPQGLMAMAMPLPQGVAVGATSAIGDDGGYSFVQIVQQATVTNASGYYLRFLDSDGHSLPAPLFVKGIGQVTLLVSYTAASGDNTQPSPLVIEPYHNAVVLADTQSSLVYYAETADPALETRYVSVAAGAFGVSLSRSDNTMLLKATPRFTATARLASSHGPTRDEAIIALRAAGLGDDELHLALAEMAVAPAALNALYALVTYRVEASAGFIASNLSAPLQPQRPEDGDPNSDYRVFAPLYNVAKANIGAANPDRYASIGDPFALSFFTNDAFGNQLPTPSSFAATNLYFDPIVPVDQWMGVVPGFDFGAGTAPKPNTVIIRLTPSQSTFDTMSDAQRQAALATFRTISDQLTGPGVSFYVETSLALQADNVSLVQFPVDAADSKKVIDMITGIVAWLSGTTEDFPGAVTIAMAVTGPGTLPPLFAIAVLFGIQRDPNLISPYLKDQFGTILYPSAQNVAATLVANTGGVNNLSAFAADFVAAFPAQKLAVGMNGTQSVPPQQLSSTAKARRALKSLKLANDGSGGARVGAQSIWAAAASLLDISIGIGPQAGPRFLSPKPLDNALDSGTVPMPTMPPTLPQLPAQRQFVNVDLDQLNRGFFQTVDDVLGPASAAQAFEQARAAYDTIVRGRESLAQKYSKYEVEWLFDAKSPFTGTHDQLVVAATVFEQQMRAALMTAYAVDTIGQFDVRWNQPVSAAADDAIELFGPVEAILDGEYAWTGITVTNTTTSPHGLATGDRVFMSFTVTSGGTPANGLYTVAVTDELHFTIVMPNGAGSGVFVGTRQNAGLSTAHVAISSQGPSPLTFLYGNPDVAERATVPFDLRFNVTNLQYFLGPAGEPGEARPSLWLQLIDPYPQGIPHIGPAETLTTIPVVLRQYPTPPTLVSQGWADYTPQPSGNPIADGANWSYLYTYQALLAAQDQVNSTITYNTDLSATPQSAARRKALAASDGPFSLFAALARASAVIGVVRPILQNLADPNWAAAVASFAGIVDEVKNNSNWNPTLTLASAAGLANVTDSYVITDARDPGGTQEITLSWPPAQGESSFADATLSLTALDPAGNLAPYPNQTLVRTPEAITVTVPDAPVGALGVAQLIEVDALNVLAAENALAAVQVERNLITLTAPDGTSWQTVSEFVYMTPQVRSSQPVTPFIDHAQPIDVATLPNQGSGAACPPSPASLCQRVYTIMANLLADPAQAASLVGAHLKSNVTSGTKRRVKVGCSFQFAVPSATGLPYDDTSITPLVPIVLARSFDIDGHDEGQLGDFSTMFAAAIAGWASNNAIIFGPDATPAGARLVFDITLYAALSGADTPVLQFSNLQLKLTNIDPA